MQTINRRRKTPFIFLTIFAIILGFFGIQFFLKIGLFKIWGELILDDSLTSAEKTFLEGLLTDQKLEKNLKISAKFESEKLSSADALLYEIYVPVTGFYSAKSTLNFSDTEALLSEITSVNYESTAEVSSEETATKLIPISALNSTEKLLKIDENYYLDDFDSGAFFRYLVVESDSEDEKSQFSDLIISNLQTFPEKSTVLSFAQTGVTALSRAMQTKLNQVGDASYFAEKIQDFLSSKDLTHISNESSFSNSASSSNICSSWKMFSAISAIGTDIVELTGNHNNDCGTQANLDSIAYYDEQGIMTVGGGENAEEAAKPLELSEKNQNITLLAYNYSTGGYTTGSTPGANLYSEEKAISDISAAKERGDFIIVDFQYFECYCYPDEGAEMPACDSPISSSSYGEYPDQQALFRKLIDLGADIVVGVSAHQPQTYELYNGGKIYYGLGNLFFDQTYWPGTERGIILTHYFWNGKLLQTRFSPTIYDESLQVELMNEEDSEWFINRLNAARD